MARHKKKKTPSRIKYEQTNPTVSCRVSREIYDSLEKVKEIEGKSFADILKIGLGILEVQVKKEGEVMKKGHAAGYRKGYAEAERLYIVTYRCNICGETLAVTTDDEKKAINKYMQEHGWRHAACHERK